MYYKDTEMARNCNVFNDHQSVGVTKVGGKFVQ